MSQHSSPQRSALGSLVATQGSRSNLGWWSRSQQGLVSAALGMGLGLLAACSGSEAPDAASPGAPASSAAGQQLFTAKGCVLCHGAEGQGTLMGPAFKDLKTHWERGQLASFLADPNSFLKEDARLAQQAAKYPQPMAPLPNTGEAERLALADWLLR